MNEILELLHVKVQELIASLNWKSFRLVQELLIQTFFRTPADIVASSPTASGKTEAAALPAFSDLSSNPGRGFGILWISPLRALINDTFIRLQPIGAALDIPVYPWHGDISHSSKVKARVSPDGLLIITPESLESNLIRHRERTQAMFANVRTVVIDELHSLLDRERGQHVLSLLSRLFTLIGHRPRIIALSATLGDFDSARRFLNPDAPESVEVIDCQEDDHEIQVAVVGRLMPSPSVNEKGKFIVMNPEHALALADSLTPAAFRHRILAGVKFSLTEKEELPDPYAHILQDILHLAQEASNLVFFNRRDLLERLADRLHQIVTKLEWADDPFFHHHSSLAKDVREHAEGLLKAGRFVTVLATSSLELGIDMRSVFCVLQVQPTFTVSSDKQRTGRSGRGEGEPRRHRVYTLDDAPNEAADITDLLYPESLLGTAVEELMLRGELEPSAAPRLHLSTLVHQLMALLLQEGPMAKAILHHQLCVKGAFRRVDAKLFGEVLDSMEAKDLTTHTSEGEVTLGLLGEKVAGSYKFLAVFSTEMEFEVFHKDRPIGKIPITFYQREGSEIILDGKRWTIERINERARRINVTPSDRAEAPVFFGRGGAIDDIVVREMLNVLRRDSLPDYLDPDTKQLLLASRTVASKAGLLQRSVLIYERGIYWFPWVGSQAMITLSLAADADALKRRSDFLALYYPSLTRDDFVEHLKRIAEGKIDPMAMAALLPEKRFERFDGFLSKDLLITAAAADRLNLPSAKQAAIRALMELGAIDSTTTKL